MFDRSHVCPRSRTKGNVIHCHDPLHPSSRKRCNQPGISFPADIAAKVFGDMEDMNKSKLKICTKCYYDRRNRLLAAEREIKRQRISSPTLKAPAPVIEWRTPDLNNGLIASTITVAEDPPWRPEPIAVSLESASGQYAEYQPTEDGVSTRKELADFAMLAKKYFSAKTTHRSADTGAHQIVQSTRLTIVLLSPVSKKYNELQERQKRRRNRALLEIVDLLGLTASEAAGILLSSALNSCTATVPDPHTPIAKAMVKIGAALPLSAKDAAALLLSRQYTKRDTTFIRSYIGGLPPLREITAAKWSFLSEMPSLMILSTGSTEWTNLQRGCAVISSLVGRSVECVRMNLIEAVQSHFTGMKEIGRWPRPPNIASIPNDRLDTTVVLLLSIDSGTGTLKLMARFVNESTSQRTSDILLLSEAHGVKETFEDLSRVFHPLSKEIDNIRRDGVTICGMKIDVTVLFVGDFKVLYALTGEFGPSSSFPCPSCCTPKRFMDCTLDELNRISMSHSDQAMTLNCLHGRSEVKDLQGRPDKLRLQRGGKYNLMRLYRDGQAQFPITNIIPPPLHIKLGIINKLVKTLDAVVEVWNRNQSWIKSDGEQTSPAMALLASALSAVGARRERYYSGELAGAPCTNLMVNMHNFCSLFFHRDAGTWGSILIALPSTETLEVDLKELAEIYVGSRQVGEEGLGYFLATQSHWNPRMLERWSFICNSFVQKLKSAIWRPSGRCATLDGAGERQKWLHPLLMPKLHCMLAHVYSVVVAYGYWAALGEESFEHFQQVSQTSRRKHVHNKPIGAQICEDIQYAWLLSSPRVLAAQQRAEENRILSGAPIRKRKFGMPKEKVGLADDDELVESEDL